MNMNALNITKSHLAANGFQWTALFVLRKCVQKCLILVERGMNRLEQKLCLPGDNTLARNYAMWQGHDWTLKGEEWTASDEWKKALVKHVLLKYIEPGRVTLEVGPGAGRWSEVLQTIAGRLILVDLADKCIEVCRDRFSKCSNVEYHVNDGRTLRFLANESVDSIWSFDVFVHINALDTASYIQECQRVLKPGGIAVIHHSKGGTTYENGWRSNSTAEAFQEMLHRNNLDLVSEFDSWGDQGQYDVRHCGDVITVFAKNAV
jgi:ubiquinone/menaquinone biosynthesis C-methylase UbiE